jgi:argininosuccinate synthase
MINTPILLLWYDKYHTPLEQLATLLPHPVTLVVIQLDEEAPEVLTHWPVHTVDARQRFCNEYVSRAIKANAVYQHGYYLSAALSRPLQAEICAELSEEFEAITVIHGLAGNDQFRFELILSALAPHLEIIPITALLGSRNNANADSYTISDNLWGRSFEAGNLAEPWFARNSEQIVPEPIQSHVISFENGLPVALDDEVVPLLDLVAQLNMLGKTYGIGVTDITEDGLVGLKTRAIYEAPAASILIAAHRDLEQFVCSRAQNNFKGFADTEWAQLVYNGGWLDPQRAALDAYMDSVNGWVTGDVRLNFSQGAIQITGRRSPHALYDESNSIWRAGQDFGVEAMSELRRLQGAHTYASVKRRTQIIGD